MRILRCGRSSPRRGARCALVRRLLGRERRHVAEVADDVAVGEVLPEPRARELVLARADRRLVERGARHEHAQDRRAHARRRERDVVHGRRAVRERAAAHARGCAARTPEAARGAQHRNPPRGVAVAHGEAPLGVGVCTGHRRRAGKRGLAREADGGEAAVWPLELGTRRPSPVVFV